MKQPDKTDLQINRLFKNSAPEPEERGFTNRVMRRLPDRKGYLSPAILTLSLIIAGILTLFLSKNHVSDFGTYMTVIEKGSGLLLSFLQMTLEHPFQAALASLAAALLIAYLCYRYILNL